MKFTKYLKYLVDSEQYRLMELSRAANVNASDLSKIINGKRPCGGRMMAQILTGLGEEHRPQALVTWLIDQIPPQFQHLVHVVRAENSSVVRDATPPDVRTLEGALEVLRKTAEVNDTVQTVVLNMALAFTVPG